jgi:thioredoxin-dependent peroxiredoxin
MLQVGDKAPNFTSTDENGKKVSLKDLKGRKVVLYFYPTDDTPTCTQEACSFRDNFSRLKKHAVVLGVSPDTEKSHAKFKEKYDLPFSLLADTDHSIVEGYGVWREKKTFGKIYIGVVRTTFIIDEKGIISHIFTVTRVKGHVDEVLKALTS